MKASIAKPKAKPTPRLPKPRPSHTPGNPATAPKIRFSAKLLRPLATQTPVTWTFLTLPSKASNKLPSRGMTSVKGTFNGIPFHASLQPDGQGGHWLKVDENLREATNVHPGDLIALAITPSAEDSEPTVPPALQRALATALPTAQAAWSDITPAARRDWIHWIESAKRHETRTKRIHNACDMLAKGKRRPCCFDRSGMYSNSLSCPIADESSSDPL